MIKGYPDGPWDEYSTGYPPTFEGERRRDVERRVNMADWKIRQALCDENPSIGDLVDALEFLGLARRMLRSEI